MTQPYPGDPLRVDLGQRRRREKLRPVLLEPCVHSRRGEPAGVLGSTPPRACPALDTVAVRGAEATEPLRPLRSVLQGRLSGERGSILPV